MAVSFQLSAIDFQMVAKMGNVKGIYFLKYLNNSYEIKNQQL
jgi:hypothetical protein